MSVIHVKELEENVSLESEFRVITLSHCLFLTTLSIYFQVKYTEHEEIGVRTDFWTKLYLGCIIHQKWP